MELELKRRLYRRIVETSKPMSAKPTDVETRIGRIEGIRAVVFDVYGTLLCSGVGDISLDDTSGRESTLWRLVDEFDLPLDQGTQGLSERFHAAIESDHQRRKAGGEPYPEVDIREIWREWARDLGILGALESRPGGVQEWALAYELAVNPVWPYQGVRETLGELRKRGLPIGIVSNAQFYTPIALESLLGASMEALGFRESLCVWSWEQGRGKPSTKLYEESARRLRVEYGLEPSQALYIGNDLLKDIWAASQVGFRTGLFSGDARSLRLREGDERIQGLQPDAVLKSVGDVLELF